jgi:type IV pilus assembly protein PilM
LTETFSLEKDTSYSLASPSRVSSGELITQYEKAGTGNAMAKSSAVWGIDLGQCALKALRCTLDSDGQTIIADKYDYIEYPKILGQPEADPEELIHEALTEFLSRNNLAGDKVAVSVSGQAGLSRFFKPPPVEPSKLPEIVKYEVKQQIPFPIEDVIWDWQQLGGAVVEGRTQDAEVGLFAMKRDAVFRALKPFDDAEIEVDIVQLSPLSIFNVVCHDILDQLPDPEDIDPDNPPESTVVMSIGTDTTDLIVTNGLRLWMRNIPIGGNHFTRHLSRELKLTQTKAEQLKRNARQSENPKEVFKAMRPVFNDLVNEVQRSLQFFLRNEKTAAISEIVMLGNAAKLPGLRQYLNKQLEMEVAKVSEFSKLKGSEVIAQPSFSSNVLSFATCYGLCLQGLRQGSIKTNLLPREIEVERIIRAKKPWVLASVSMITLGLVLSYFFNTVAWWKVNPDFELDGRKWKDSMSQVKSQKSKSDQFVSADSELKETQDKLDLISQELVSASEDKGGWIEVYSALYQAFPQDPTIKESLEAGIQTIDPREYAFEDREEIYIDHIESVFHEDLSTWVSTIKPVFDKQFAVSETDLMAAKEAGADADDVDLDLDAEDSEAEGGLAGTPGWVIEIKGHHFHNSRDSLSKLNFGKRFVVSTLINNLLSKEDVELPAGDDPDRMFKYSDLGILYPTITRTSPLKDKLVVYDPTASAIDTTTNRRAAVRRQPVTPVRDKDSDEEMDVTEEASFTVKEYNFVVQMAWVPRSPEERLAARAERREAEAAAAQAAADAAAAETEEEEF